MKKTFKGAVGNALATVGTGATITPGGVNLQIGANQSQSLTLDLDDMRSSASGITGTAGATGFTAANSVTDGKSNRTTEAALDVTSASTASAAITKIQIAIEKVSAERLKIGVILTVYSTLLTT
ncbi:hypothetical protein [Peribacillus deserti]|uniref:hypothetical protein n=1 Tax=Peribacillus deserti TaxID=673318 RepID=UPI0026A884B0